MLNMNVLFENRILRRIFGSKRDENGECRRIHNEERHSLYRSPNIVRVFKSKRLRCQNGGTEKINREIYGMNEFEEIINESDCYQCMKLQTIRSWVRFLAFKLLKII